MTFSLDFSAGSPPRVLAIGAHPDDIEIGCGGTLLRLRQQLPASSFWLSVFSGSENRRQEAACSAARLLGEGAGEQLIASDFRDGFFPGDYVAIKERFEELKRDVQPTLVLTHFREDRHQDHRLLSDLAWSTFRNATILEYEVPKYDGDFGTPNLYVTLERDTARAKVDHILSSFPSQQGRDWFDPEVFQAVLRLRGMESRSPSGYAEAFYSRKAVV